MTGAKEVMWNFAIMSGLSAAIITGFINAILKVVELRQAEKLEERKIKRAKSNRINDKIQEAFEKFISSVDKTLGAINSYTSISSQYHQGIITAEVANMNIPKLVKDMNDGMGAMADAIVKIKLLMPQSKEREKIVDYIEKMRDICEYIMTSVFEYQDSGMSQEKIKETSATVEKYIDILQHPTENLLKECNDYLHKFL